MQYQFTFVIVELNLGLKPLGNMLRTTPFWSFCLFFFSWYHKKQRLSLAIHSLSHASFKCWCVFHFRKIHVVNDWCLSGTCGKFHLIINIIPLNYCNFRARLMHNMSVLKSIIFCWNSFLTISKFSFWNLQNKDSPRFSQWDLLRHQSSIFMW